MGQLTYPTDQRCIIEDPAHPGFHYHLSERWLSNTPPPETEPASAQTPVRLPMAALDRMVQMILAQQQIWRAVEDEPIEQRNIERHLGTDPEKESGSAASKTILPGARTSRRNKP